MSSLKLVMIRRWISILLGRTAVAVPQGVGRAYSLTEVKGFYNDLTRKVGNGTDLDPEGIPMSLLGGNRHAYFPIAIFQYGLANYDLWLLEGKSSCYHAFEKLAQWALAHQRADGSWDCFGPIGSSKYTVSAMGQGEGAALLLRAFRETQNTLYLQAARQAIDFMLRPIEQGGTAFYRPDGSIVLEEYPGPDRSTVLNGWIFAFFGLYDLCKTIHENVYQERLERTVDALADLLSSYDMGYWSRYDLSGKVASPAYHSLHIALLQVMAEITGRQVFAAYGRRWQKDEESRRNKILAVVQKVFQKLTEQTDTVIIK